MVQVATPGKSDGRQRTMTPPAAKRQRSVDHQDSTRFINVVKGGLSIMCPSDSMGMLIGKGGSGLRDMQERSGVKVSLQETKSMPEGAKERGVGLSGTMDCVAVVEKIIFDKLNARRVTSLAPSPAEEEFEIAYQAAKAAGVEPSEVLDPADDPSRLTVVRWVMNNAQCGWLIGKGGSGIQNIEASSGAEVRVANEKSTSKSSGDRFVYIKGNADQREKALEIIRNNPKIVGRVAAPDESEVAAVHVPSKAIGFILGHRGASIQALTEKTGAQLRVAPANEITTGSSEHRVDITGGPKQIVAARHALADRVEEWKVTNNHSNSPDDVEYSLKIAVPQPLIGHIIGKGGVFVREVLALTSVQVKIQQDTGSPTLWGDACCVLLSGTMSNIVSAQQMILERIANISDRLKEMVPNAVNLSADANPDAEVKMLEVNIQLPDAPPPVLAPPPHGFQQPAPYGQPPPFGFAPSFGQPRPSGPFMPGQQQFQAPFQPQFQQGGPQGGPPQGFRAPAQSPGRSQAPGGPPQDITFTSIGQLHAPGLTRASKQPGGLELLVDNSVVGSIIGKGGQTIRKMTAESGALIQVQGRDEVSPSQRERKVTVTSEENSVLLKAANMICAVLRKNEALASGAMGNGASQGGDRGGQPSGQFKAGSGPPPSSPAPSSTPGPYQFPQQQQPPSQQQQFQFAPANSASPFPQGFAGQQPAQGAPQQQAFQYAPSGQAQAPPQQQQVIQQGQPAQAAGGPYAQQQQPPQQTPQQQQQPQFGAPAQVYYLQQPAVTNGQPVGGAPQGVQYAQVQQPQQPQQQPQQQQQPPQQQQQGAPAQASGGQFNPQQQQQQARPQQVQQLPLQQGQQPASGTPASPAPVYGWVYDPATGTYTAAPATPSAAPQGSSFAGQANSFQQR